MLRNKGGGKTQNPPSNLKSVAKQGGGKTQKGGGKTLGTRLIAMYFLPSPKGVSSADTDFSRAGKRIHNYRTQSWEIIELMYTFH